jgi:hypothetical protein
MSGICCAENSQFQQVSYLLWSKLSVSACLESVVVKLVSFSMFATFCGQNSQFSACLELVVVLNNKFQNV